MKIFKCMRCGMEVKENELECGATDTPYLKHYCNWKKKRVGRVELVGYDELGGVISID